MVKKLQKQSTDKKKGSTKLPRIAKDAAQQIWLAGLGAFAKAQEEGSKVFDALVQEGLTLQHETQAAAEQKIAAATDRVADMSHEVGSRVAGRWDKLENIFEDRVSKALVRLGVPSAREVKALRERIDALTQGQGKSAPKAADKAAAKATAKKAATEATVKKDAVKAAPRKAAAKPAAKAAAKPAAKAATSKPDAAQPTASAPSAPAVPSAPSVS